MTATAHHYRATVDNLWDGSGSGLPAAQFEFELGTRGLELSVHSPFFSDPAPQAPTGSTPRLWDYEVAELFLLGADQHYLEVELGPHGHYLILQLRGTRRVIHQGAAIEYEVTRTQSGQHASWLGRAHIPAALLPPSPALFNAYTIHGSDPHRVYRAHRACPGSVPDFHQLASFAPLVTACVDLT